MKHALALVFLVALGVRIVAATRVAIIDRDSVEYLAAASDYAHAGLSAGLSHHYPPAYPLLAALPIRLGLDPETAGFLVSVLVGALAAVVGAALARSSPWRTLACGLVIACDPTSVELGVEVLADGTFVLLVLGALLAARRSHVLAGTLASLSYLARPEGLVVLLVLAARARRRALLVLAPAIVCAVPYVLAIKKDPALTGGAAGEWKLTKKRELFREAGGDRVFPVDERGERRFSVAGAATVLGELAGRLPIQLAWTVFSLKEVLVLVALLAFVTRKLPEGLPDLDVVLALVITWSLIRTDLRYGKIAAALLLPWLGSFVATRARPKWLLAIFLIVTLVIATRPRNTRKIAWRTAGEACHGLERIASTDRRVAFYAGARHIELGTLEDARREGAQALVVRSDHPLASLPGAERLELGSDYETVVIVPLP